MAFNYYLPTAVRLQFARGAVASATVTNGLQAQWQRAFEFMDCGYSTGLFIYFGSMTGELVATDLAMSALYAHNFATHGAYPATGVPWTPADLTPIDGSDLLVTETINLYHAPTGAAGDLLTSFACLARPEQIDPRLLIEGLNAAQVAWRWEIRDDSAADVTPPP